MLARLSNGGNAIPCLAGPAGFLLLLLVTATGLGSIVANIGTTVGVVIAFALVILAVVSAVVTRWIMSFPNLDLVLPTLDAALNNSGYGCVPTLVLGTSFFALFLAGFAAAGSVIVSFVVAGVGSGAVIAACLIAVVIGTLARFASEQEHLFAGAVAIAVSVAIAIAGALTGSVIHSIVIAGVLSGTVILAVTVAIGVLARENRWKGPGVSIFVTALILICLAGAQFLAPLRTWEQAGPILLFLGLLTLLNAPFDWVSLGLTRGLLRRGLELGEWWPYGLAIVDAGLAAVIVAALALTMVVGVQGFDALAIHGGGVPILPLEPLFAGIAANPSSPEYWWLYALLLSTMIPSLANLVIGGASLVRGLPGLPSLLLRKIPASGNAPKFDRAWIGTLLTAQVATGAALGIAAQVLLVIVIIGCVMPFFGLELLDMARTVAEFNLPKQVGLLVGVSL